MGITRGAWALALVAGLYGCSDSNGPDQGDVQFDAAKVKSGLATVETVSSNPVLVSFRGLGNFLSGSSAAPSTARTDGVGQYLSTVEKIAGMLRPEIHARLVPIMRPEVLGKTYVYDPSVNQYVVDPNRTGAPPNGVRFVLYQTDVEGHPDVSHETGLADLIDAKANSSSSAGLRLIVHAGGVTYLDYSFDLSGSVASATVVVDGFLSDGTNRIDFEITTKGQMFLRGGRASIDAVIEVADQDFKVTAHVAGQAGQQNGDGEVSLVVEVGSDKVEITSTSNGGQINATVKVNGHLFATITGTSGNVVITGDGGRALTEDEMEALRQIVAFAGGVFQLISGLLAPAGVLLLIGLGL